MDERTNGQTDRSIERQSFEWGSSDFFLSLSLRSCNAPNKNLFINTRTHTFRVYLMMMLLNCWVQKCWALYLDCKSEMALVMPNELMMCKCVLNFRSGHWYHQIAVKWKQSKTEWWWWWDWLSCHGIVRSFSRFRMQTSHDIDTHHPLHAQNALEHAPEQ